MLSVLRRAILGRRHGRANADLAFRIERAIARVPSIRADGAWRAWLWRLPPEAWQEALDLKRAHLRVLVAYREVAVQAIVRKNGLESAIERAGETDRLRIETDLWAATAEVEGIRHAVRDAELDVRVRAFGFEERFGTPAHSPDARRAILAPTAERWQAWIQTVPPERLREAMRVRALDADRVLLKGRMATSKPEEVEVLQRVGDEFDSTYRRLSSPLFEAVGSPDLPEGR